MKDSKNRNRIPNESAYIKNEEGTLISKRVKTLERWNNDSPDLVKGSGK